MEENTVFENIINDIIYTSSVNDEYIINDEYINNDIIYTSSVNDEILYSELNNNILAFITKKNSTHIQIFNILEKKNY